MSELADGWGLLVAGFLAWVAVSVIAGFVLGRIFGGRS